MKFDPRRIAYVRHVTLLWAGSLLLSVGALVLLLSALPERTDGTFLPALAYRLALRSVSSPYSISESGRSIVAHLDEMEVLLMEDGVEVKRLKILSRGRPGTPWETPTGYYSVRTKEPEHFSTFGEVWMPWSMQFYGNFFIHGWPTHPDGTPVPEGYSGGCIRLSTPDAKEVYEFAKRGTPVVVRASESFVPGEKRYFLRGGGELPDVSAKTLLVADIETGQVLWERHADEIRPLGTVSALLSAQTALETVNQYKKVSVGELLAGKGASRMRSGERPDEITIGALVYPLIFSGNEAAARAFAREHGTKEFIARMNEKASAVGMTRSSFASVDLSAPENVGTASDVFLLLKNISEQKRFILDASRAPHKKIVDADGYERFSWTNDNTFVVREDVRYRGGIVAAKPDGVAATIFSVPVGEFVERDIAVILLGTDDAYSDIETIRDFVEKHFYWGPESSAPIALSPDESLSDVLHDIFSISRLKDKLYQKVLAPSDAS